MLEQGGTAALVPAVLLAGVLVGLRRGVLVAGSPPAAAAGPRRCRFARGRRRLSRELLVVLKRLGLARWRRRGLLGRGSLGRLGGGRGRLGGGRRLLLLLLLLPAEAAVLGAQLVQPPLQLVDSLPLGMDEALLVLHDGGELLQVEHGAHRVLQQALHAPAAGAGPAARTPARPPAGAPAAAAAARDAGTRTGTGTRTRAAGGRALPRPGGNGSGNGSGREGPPREPAPGRAAHARVPGTGNREPGIASRPTLGPDPAVPRLRCPPPPPAHPAAPRRRCRLAAPPSGAAGAGRALCGALRNPSSTRSPSP